MANDLRQEALKYRAENIPSPMLWTDQTVAEFARKIAEERDEWIEEKFHALIEHYSPYRPILDCDRQQGAREALGEFIKQYRERFGI